MKVIIENENIGIYKNDDLAVDRLFIVACRDRKIKDEERWVLASLSKDEALQLYQYLGTHLWD